mmetsp:Transcript_34029/g.104483  ORF Transcript_34029/g.104483 Transcript_34029/m.104483 type:complete len:300 (-) Transcript_34029:1516-2415(-)
MSPRSVPHQYARASQPATVKTFRSLELRSAATCSATRPTNGTKPSMQITQVVMLAAKEPLVENWSVALHANAATAAPTGSATRSIVLNGSWPATRRRFRTNALLWRQTARRPSSSSAFGSGPSSDALAARPPPSNARRRSSSSPTFRNTSSKSVPATPSRTGGSSASNALSSGAAGASLGSANSRRPVVRAMTRCAFATSSFSSKRRSHAFAPGAVAATTAATRFNKSSCLGFAFSRSWRPSSSASAASFESAASSAASTTNLAPQPSDRFSRSGASAQTSFPATMMATTSPSTSASSM